MKKAISILIIAVFIVTIAGCATQEIESTEPNQENEAQVIEPQITEETQPKDTPAN